MTETKVTIGGMSCGHCVATVKSALERLEGVTVRGVEIGSAAVAYDPEAVGPELIAGAIEAEGFTIGERDEIV